MPSRRIVRSPLSEARGQRRESAAKRGYGRAWRAATRQFLAEQPLCVECAKEGRTEPATDVDHVVPHRGDATLFWDRGNWQGLCHSHHARKTRRGE